MGWANTRESLAALPRLDDPEAVEALAKWLWEQSRRVSSEAVGYAVSDTGTWPLGTGTWMENERFRAMARAILSALAAGGRGE